MHRLIGVLASLAIAVAVGCTCFFSVEADKELVRQAYAEKPIYIYAEKNQATDFDLLSFMIRTRLDGGEQMRVLQGSSELSLVNPCSSHPANFFADGRYGFSTISIGKAGYQDLWHAIEIGAMSNKGFVPGNKTAFIIGMQWFMGDGCTSSAFLNSFSPGAYEQFMANENISKETKEYVRGRVLELGVNASRESSLSSHGLLESVDYAVEEAVESFSRPQEELKEVALNLPLPKYATEYIEPDWQELEAVSLEEGKQSCKTNDVGVYDEYYEEYYVPWLKEIDGTQYEPFLDWNQKELDDFKAYLRVCKETGIEPLVIILPVKASYYDYTAYNKESRSAYCQMIKSTCDSFGVQYLDCTIHDYDTYYMRDVMHFGWLGWVDVDRAMYEFFGGSNG